MDCGHRSTRARRLLFPDLVAPWVGHPGRMG